MLGIIVAAQSIAQIKQKLKKIVPFSIHRTTVLTTSLEIVHMLMLGEPSAGLFATQSSLSFTFIINTF